MLARWSGWGQGRATGAAGPGRHGLGNRTGRAAMVEHLDTGTGADLLSYEKYVDTTTGLERLTRVATASEEWVVRDWDGEVYYIRFDLNFSKKHLATFSKDRERTEKEAYFAWLNSGKTRGAGENWQAAEHRMMLEKMATTAQNRAVAGQCQCGHPFNRHPGGNACTVPGCGCAKFTTPFGASRTAAGKPTENPLAGAQTNRTTFILLNWVPKGEFESVVVQSIQAHEKPTGWRRGDPLAKAAGDEAVLRWDFGPARIGAVVQSQVGVAPNLWGRKQGCYVKARKTATDWGKQTWKIFHMETSGAHAPF